MDSSKTQPASSGPAFKEILIIGVRLVLALVLMVFSASAFYEAALALYKLDLFRMIGAYFLFFCSYGLGPMFWPFGSDH
ncbi:hypothetical protein [Pseudovibrio sp. Tun.PSC04-5.I4]|uniref:hypothetical protein n=1 Tax=Pseudovibrio sp. Tun.PSC04-5.I4 TaxID=1798213 RepID=UPI00088F1B92|nr:hypothetical protein [Pseudovibrio sp. Tun.PSC04-5.I4]SDQ90947.1 hypothetical protein SAMN04515695_1858 [Pseudovibrio sp. Tun.PSC04-5.I4]